MGQVRRDFHTFRDAQLDFPAVVTGKLTISPPESPRSRIPAGFRLRGCVCSFFIVSMSSIGKQLARARTARNLSIEDIAFQTRIPAARLRDLENDDLSRFANLIYARGFLKIYSRHLELDISDYLDQFNTAEFSHASGHEYVQTANATHNLPQAVFTDYGRSRSPGLFILIAALAVGGGIYWWSTREKPEDEAIQTTQPARQTPAPAPIESRPALPSNTPPPVTPPPVVAAVPEPEPEPPRAAEAVAVPPPAPIEPPATEVPPAPSSGKPVKAEVIPEIEPETGEPVEN